MKNLLYFFALVLLFSCETTRSYDEKNIPLEPYKIEDGFKLEVLASEPLLKAPVAIDFDAKGRIWVVQMPGYMSDMQGSEEDEPIGSIRILEDLDNDGVMDHAKIFLDSLVMPRALAHVYGGLLYAQPPNLYFVDIKDDKPVNRVLVDSIYAVDGNPEHQPNGLLLNVDNWIYNAKSNFRYQRKNGKWIKEATTFRGQWGISHDNFGRLYYNDNSRQLLGDHVLPNRLIRNKNYIPRAGVAQMLTKDQRVYPLHPTTVNRGYSPGVLNADSILVHATAAAKPLVYRGGAFPDAYDQNVFVCIPEGNLIKRNILTFTGDSTIAEQAWQNKEFLAATDEGFRPVNLNNGPDGSMYIVDMHRGMIGHHAYLSPYLKKKNEVTRLDTILDYGRILKVTHVDYAAKPIADFDVLNATELVQLLKHKNGWVRDRAQHYLVFKEMKEAIAELRELALQSENEYTQIHALHTLEGLNSLDFDFLTQVASTGKPQVAAHAVILAEVFATEENTKKAKMLFENLIAKNSPTIDLYLGSSIGKWVAVNEDVFLKPMVTLLKRHAKGVIFKEAVLSGLAGVEETVLAGVNSLTSFEDDDFKTALSNILENKKSEKVNPIFLRKSLNEDNRTAGAKMFYQICASCHGAEGQGIEGLAPPLMKSEHVADSERLALIVLHGLQGPISVNGKDYNLNLAMPGLIRNSDISDKDIADIIAYVSNAFSDNPKGVKKEKVAELRTLKPKSGAEYTLPELLEFSKK